MDTGDDGAAVFGCIPTPISPTRVRSLGLARACGARGVDANSLRAVCTVSRSVELNDSRALQTWAWRRRYIILCGGTLFIFRDHDAVEPAEAVEMVCVSTGVAARVSLEPSDDGICLRIDTPGEARTLLLRGPGAEEGQRWMEALVRGGAWPCEQYSPSGGATGADVVSDAMRAHSITVDFLTLSPLFSAGGLGESDDAVILLAPAQGIEVPSSSGLLGLQLEVELRQRQPPVASTAVPPTRPSGGMAGFAPLAALLAALGAVLAALSCSADGAATAAPGRLPDSASVDVASVELLLDGLHGDVDAIAAFVASSGLTSSLSLSLFALAAVLALVAGLSSRQLWAHCTAEKPLLPPEASIPPAEKEARVEQHEPRVRAPPLTPAREPAPSLPDADAGAVAAQEPAEARAEALPEGATSAESDLVPAAAAASAAPAPAPAPVVAPPATLLATGAQALRGALAPSGKLRDVAALLSAIEASLVPLLSSFGPSMAFAAQNDARNVRKVRAAASAAAAAPDTASLQDGVDRLLSHEVASGCHKPAEKSAVLADPSAAIGLTWLSRSLRFICMWMEGVCAGGAPVDAAAATKRYREAMSAAYEASLAPYHGWLNRNIFNGCAKHAPGYASLIATLAPTADEATREALVLMDMADFATAAAPVADAVEAALARAKLVDSRRA
ncbi:hypothetical protein EMIHUDRAFT_102546 [Emiliania huxleyi CCMP1516]|uniref:Pleckstrin homology domain-containing family A member 8 n=2 Tax=Emiliania huxleyi TaxID=2903 RepID=A0A0D3J2Y6_EMIH1|nr:hypothetical protein EMIHUDRAFT_102546 [Emiliania huxleyi CCMP1516]EOD17871.1 hypothetical protein EMIHUDRAFT_102546 [Emiliania huxleyi CCMP1516]|eukprot:XP_005770300.1 hypothetical protein EMIHUDRAFT_102546 [Emiliania huxleyi CCMP1516]